MHDQDIGPSPKMLRSSTGMSDAGGKHFRQDYSGAVSGDSEKAEASELESRRLRRVIWGSLGPSARGKQGKLKVHTDRKTEVGVELCSQVPRPSLGRKGHLCSIQFTSCSVGCISQRERRRLV